MTSAKSNRAKSLMGMWPALLSTLLATGCNNMDRARADIDASSRQAEHASRDLSSRQRSTTSGTSLNGHHLVGDPVFPENQRHLPAAFAREFVFAEELPSRLPSIVELINSRTSIPVKATEDALAFAARTDETPRVDVMSLLGPEFGGNAPSSGTIGLTLPAPGAARTANPAIAAAATPVGPGGRGAVFRFSGTLEGFLDTVAARFGISWRYENDQIVLFRFQTRVFSINALAADEVGLDLSVSQETQPGNGNQGSQTTGASGGVQIGNQTRSGNTDRLTTRNEATIRARIKLWDEIKANIERMVSGDGQVAVSQGLSTITITDVPARVEQIARYVEQENARLSRQVAIDFAIYAVQVEREDGYGLDWQTVFRVLAQDYGFSLATAAGAAATAANVITTGVVLDRTQGSTVTQSNSIGGSRAFVRALSTQGSVATVQATTLTAPNGQPAIFRDAKERDYVAGFNVQTSTGTGGGLLGSSGERIVTPQVQTAVDSFTLAAMPRILDGRRVMLQFSLSIEELMGFRSAQSQFGSFELRDVNRKNLLQRVNLRSGQTLMIASVEQDSARDRRAGQGDSLIPLLGGGRDTTRARTIFVLVMTPQVGEGL